MYIDSFNGRHFTTLFIPITLSVNVANKICTKYVYERCFHVMQYKCGKMKRFWSLTLSYCQAHADVSVQVEWITAVSGSLPSLYSFMCRLDHVTQLYKWTLSNRNIQGIINRWHFFLRSFLHKQEMTDSLYLCINSFSALKIVFI